MPDELHVLYDLGDEDTALYAFPPGAKEPKLLWNTGTPNWAWTRSQLAVADVRGIGKPEVCILYDDGIDNGKNYLSLYVAPAGETPRSLWKGAYAWSDCKLTTAEVRPGKGPELCILYRNGDESTTLFVFDPKAKDLKMVWQMGRETWSWTRSQLAAADVRGVGKPELCILYNDENGKSSLYVAPVGETPRSIWKGSYGWADCKLATAEVRTGKGPELCILYPLREENTALLVFDARTQALVPVWQSGERNWIWQNSLLTAADILGDGKQQLCILYQYAGNDTALFGYDTETAGFTKKIWRGDMVWRRMLVQFQRPVPWTAPITHVFVVMLENHSFDCVFAMSGIPGIKAATTADSNVYGKTTYTVAKGAPQRLTTDPGHEFTDVLEQLCGSGATTLGNWIWANSKLTTAEVRKGKGPELCILYRYPHDTELFVFDAGNKSPVAVWRTGEGKWDWTKSQIAAADVRGVGKPELCILYDEGGNYTSLLVSPAGEKPTVVWNGNWVWANSKLAVAEVRPGKGPELCILYRYADNTTLFAFDAKTRQPEKVWKIDNKTLDWTKVQLGVADVRGIGKPELCILHNEDPIHNITALFVSPAIENPKPIRVWGGNWAWADCKLTTAEVRKGKGPELCVLYQYGGNNTALFVFFPGSGKVDTFKVWETGEGIWGWQNSLLAAADILGTGTPQMCILYQYSTTGDTALFACDAANPLPKQVWRSGLYPAIHNSGFAANYATSTTEGPAPAAAHIKDIMACFDTERELPVLYKLAKEFAICDHWFSSLPGSTWPNRFFVHGASSSGLDTSPTHGQIADWEKQISGGFEYRNGSIFDRLKKAGVPYRVYHDIDWDPPPLLGTSVYSDDWWLGNVSGAVPIVAAIKGVSILDAESLSHFASDLQGSYDYKYTFIEPHYGDLALNTYRGGSSQHPMDDMKGGENLVAAVYSAIRESPYWKSSLLIITYDEHGGFYDSVPPPPAPAPDDNPNYGYNKYGFDFGTFGVRVPAIVVSPLIPAGTVDHTRYDHASVPRLLEELWGLAPLTQRDLKAKTPLHLLSLTAPRDTPAIQVEARTAPPQTAPALPTEERIRIEAQLLPESGNLPGMLGILRKTEIELSAGTPAEIAAINARYATIRTRGEAQSCAREVMEKCDLRRRMARAQSA